jgi:hypothetical protein
MCAGCHQPSAGLSPIIPAHNWLDRDPRNVPEFNVEMSVSGAANGEYFVAGEAPVVHVRVFNRNADGSNGAPIDHTQVNAETQGGNEGCLEAGCPPADGRYNAPFFVHGPRADRQPVLTTKARVKITSNGIGPFDLSAVPANTNFTVTLDQGVNIRYFDDFNRDMVAPGIVNVPFTPATSVPAAASTTPADLAAWLNGNANFARRAIAYLETDGRLSIRSRNLGKLYSVQLGAGTITQTVFNNDTTVKVQGGFTLSNPLTKQAVPANNDPKITWNADEILYQLDPVDDLRPGTYVASLEFGDRGRIDGVNYRTPSVAKITFNVKQGEEELPPAGNCGDCHQNNSGTGFVLDYARHYKIFDDSAIDQCGACHDYQPGAVVDPANPMAWNGSKPMSRRVHAIHFGSSLNYPLSTVDYSNGDPIAGRNWNITYPQDVRNCETCHKAENTSGSWATNANRLACSGCHDSDASMAHMRLQTFDPTPGQPWSGDEEESCTACH